MSLFEHIKQIILTVLLDSEKLSQRKSTELPQTVL